MGSQFILGTTQHFAGVLQVITESKQIISPTLLLLLCYFVKLIVRTLTFPAYRDFDNVSLMSQSLSLDLLSDFLRLELATFSEMASLDLERYRFRSVFLSRQV